VGTSIPIVQVFKNALWTSVIPVMVFQLKLELQLQVIFFPVTVKVTHAVIG